MKHSNELILKVLSDYYSSVGKSIDDIATQWDVPTGGDYDRNFSFQQGNSSGSILLASFIMSMKKTSIF
eukprot:scaffold5727_cov148-Ochromonas_danica.AAC.1